MGRYKMAIKLNLYEDFEENFTSIEAQELSLECVFGVKSSKFFKKRLNI